MHLIGDVQLLARENLAGVAADGRLVGIINFTDVGFCAAAIKVRSDLAQAVARLDGVASRTGF